MPQKVLPFETSALKHLHRMTIQLLNFQRERQKKTCLKILIEICYYFVTFGKFDKLFVTSWRLGDLFMIWFLRHLRSVCFLQARSLKYYAPNQRYFMVPFCCFGLPASMLPSYSDQSQETN